MPVNCMSPTRRHFHSSQSNWRRDGKETRIRFVPNVDEGTKGEKLHEIDSNLSKYSSLSQTPFYRNLAIDQRPQS